MVVRELASSGDAVAILVVQTRGVVVFAQQRSCVTAFLRVHPRCEVTQGYVLSSDTTFALS